MAEDLQQATGWPDAGESSPAGEPTPPGAPVIAPGGFDPPARLDLTAAPAAPGSLAAVPPGPPPPNVAAGRPGPPGGGWSQPPGVPRQRSSYLDHLPGIYSESDFLARFLLIFESVLGPIDRTVGNLHHYFDPGLAPRDFVDWLGQWLGFVFDERWPEERRRELVRAAGDLYRWRGTARGLTAYIRAATGITPEVVEGPAGGGPFRFTVRLRLANPAAVDRSLVEAIIEAEKPAFAACTLELLPSA
jgi:phage tail-like protein